MRFASQKLALETKELIETTLNVGCSCPDLGAVIFRNLEGLGFIRLLDYYAEPEGGNSCANIKVVLDKKDREDEKLNEKYNSLLMSESGIATITAFSNMLDEYQQEVKNPSVLEIHGGIAAAGKPDMLDFKFLVWDDLNIVVLPKRYFILA